MLVVHATKKMLDRLSSAPRRTDESSTTALGSWYSTVLFWRPQVGLFVNESTLLPVLVPLAPASTLVERFVTDLGALLIACGARASFVEAETQKMGDWRLTKTSNRSVVGIMNEFSYLAEEHVRSGESHSLLELSVDLSKTPCGPLYKSHVSPDRELAALLAERTGVDVGTESEG